MIDLRQLEKRFRDYEQLGAVREVVQTRLADDRNQEQCRYLMRFWWQLSMSYREVGIEELEENLTPAKLAIINDLLEAASHGHDAIDKWVHKYSKELAVIKDNSFRFYESDSD